MNFHIPGPENESEGVHLAPHTHHFQGAQSPPQVHFKHPGAQPIDPSLGTGGSAGPPGNAISASPHLSAHDPVIPSGLYSDTPRSTAATPSTPSNSVSIRSPSQSRQTLPSFTPTDRSLPSRDVSDESIDDAYAAFILYCNPSFSLTTDTAELRKIFRQPPKSDGKSFSIWHLYELVKRYEEKDIKTWVELALELGVEKPALDKGQSTQKVQQYSVRLKRWMRAMHVDAFFDFLRGSPKEYYTQIPPLHDPTPDGGRDGVPAEEDLAIRALDPSMRPKRGRRKADDIEDDADRAVTPEPKRPQLDGSIEFASPHHFATPHSAYPDEFAPPPDPWAAASAVTPASLHPMKGLTPSSAHPNSLFRWRVNGTMDTPITPHPLSAVTPASTHPDSAWPEEPQSAMTPRTKSRRRHGPLVSSAWSSSASTQNGKLRGRPPSNRTVRDGPFSTFPANPKAKEATPVEMGKTPISTTVPAFPPLSIPQNIPMPIPGTESPVPQSTTSTQPPTSAKRERLQLQVPQRVSGPVHLITPPTTSGGAPPTVLVNGEAERGPMEVPALRDSPPPPRGSVFFGDSSGDEQRLTAKVQGPGKQIVCHRFRVGEDGYDSPIEEHEDDDVSEVDSLGRVRETWDVSWTLLLGGLSGEFQLKGLVISGDEGGGRGGKEPTGHRDDVDGRPEDWRDKFVKAQVELRAKEEEVRRLRDKVLDAVL
ncbi:hypothetical protein NA57DRAFT_49390 [Rhizodiscina lignyota]|uniref:ARS binding protein 2 n=1 Tax=Rhizodiscina lignyota TaxID=1504668 RepID=A0A9P4I6Z4_9PEZI|nr:hypothetical protein NA57DRAFT_49390 [Rhizodiscina lignyota]